METNNNKPATYTCPMHPEVISDQPGNCSKCGMKLVPKEGKMGGHMLRMMLLCLVPIAIVLLLPVFGVRFNASWIILIVLASCCILPMLSMRHSSHKNHTHSSANNER